MLIPCLACESRFRPEEYFQACHDYRRNKDLVFWTCPRCGNQDELRVFPGELGFGYQKRGKFEISDRLPVPGLRRQRQELRLDILLEEKVWCVPARPRQLVGAR